MYVGHGSGGIGYHGCGMCENTGNIPAKRNFTSLSKPVDIRIQELAKKYFIEKHQELVTGTKKAGAFTWCILTLPSITCGLSMVAAAAVVSAPIALLGAGFYYLLESQRQWDRDLISFLMTECLDKKPIASDQDIIDYAKNNRGDFYSYTCESCRPD